MARGSGKGGWGAGWCREKEGNGPIWWYHLSWVLEKSGKELGSLIQKRERGLVGSGRSWERSQGGVVWPMEEEGLAALGSPSFLIQVLLS